MKNVTNLNEYRNYKKAKENGTPIKATDAAKFDPNVASLLEQISSGKIYPCEPGFDKAWTQEEKDALDKALDETF